MMTTRQSLPILALLGALGLVSQASAAEPAKPVEPHNYETCVGLTESSPVKGLAYARDWKTAGGGNAALHCEALALSALGELDEAAARFQELADAMTDAPVETRAEIYGQAGSAWAVAGNLAKARGAYDTAIELLPGVPELYLGRAQVRALEKDWDGVRKDAGEALAESPSLASALTLRATALRNLGHPKAALADAERAVSLAPHNLEALLERGRMRAQTGNISGAKADWLTVIRFAKQTGRESDPAAAAAQVLLDKSEKPAQ